MSTFSMAVLCKNACSDGVIVEYVRTYQPETENAEQINGQISCNYHIEHHSDTYSSK
jgi:hypothetical protein